MLQPSFGILQGSLDEVDLITTDVFDTLLLRNGRSERTRIVTAEREFASLLKRRGWSIRPEELIHARLRAQNLAYRALNMGGGRSEVRLDDIVCR